MAGHTPVDVDPKEAQRAHDMWLGFTKLMKYSVIITAAILAVMAFVFVDW